MESFNLLIAGGQDFDNYPRLVDATEMIIHNKARHREIIIVSDAAEGAGMLGEAYAAAKGYEVVEFADVYPVRIHLHIRQEAMVKFAEAGLCFWDGHSKDVEQLISIAKASGLDLTVIYY